MDVIQYRTFAQIKKHKETLSDRNGISLNKILKSKNCQAIISKNPCSRERIFTPIQTLFTFLKQVLNPDKSCRNAVAEMAAEQLLTEGKIISTNTGSYSEARKRLPEKMIHELVMETGQKSAKKALHSWKAFGRNLKGVDGTTIILPDTKENQAIYPQQKGQKKGVGFPILRLTVVMSLTIGTVLDYAIGAFKGKGTGESTLFRSISNCIEKDDILLGDRNFPGYFLIVDLLAKKADGIFRGKVHRNYDFRKGKRLGKYDHVVEWKKSSKPAWMAKEVYDGYPDEITVREFKVGRNIYVTTLLEHKKYHKKELARIYEQRWQIELNLKSIKEIMRMDMLSCKVPEMVKKEIGVHFLAYNFVRIIMAEACTQHGNIPNQISFKGTVQLLNNFRKYFIKSNRKQNEILYSEMLKNIVKNRVGNRPGRIEPRKLKRRPKPFKLLNKPRHIEREKIAKKIARITKQAA